MKKPLVGLLMITLSACANTESYGCAHDYCVSAVAPIAQNTYCAKSTRNWVFTYQITDYVNGDVFAYATIADRIPLDQRIFFDGRGSPDVRQSAKVVVTFDTGTDGFDGGHWTFERTETNPKATYFDPDDPDNGFGVTFGRFDCLIMVRVA